MVHVLQTTQNLSFHVVVLQRTSKKCTKNYNARAQPLFCSLNILFRDFSVAVAVVVLLNSQISPMTVGRNFIFSFSGDFGYVHTQCPNGVPEYDSPWALIRTLFFPSPHTRIRCSAHMVVLGHEDPSTRIRIILNP